ncbi:MAG: hypothetical protein JNJ58_06975 [Chitinophagaceae bacterium]|nr:hypothetical protein [Chitinophagaceae bacterium]
MKYILRILLLSIFLMPPAMQVNAQEKTITKKEAKQVARDINQAIGEMAFVIEKFDWNTLGDLVDEASTLLEKNTDALVEVAKRIDTVQLQANADEITRRVEKSVDVQKLEKQLQNLANKIETVLESEYEKK